MQAKAKSNSVVTSTFVLATGILTLNVLDALGKGKPGEVAFDVRKFAGEAGYDQLTDNGKRAIGHGMTQRLADRAAKGRDKKSGKSASPADKLTAIKALADHYANGGEWAMQGGGGVKPLDRAALYLAVALVRNRQPEDVERLYRDKPDEVVRTLLTIAAIAGKYTELTTKAESDKAKELLEELTADELLSEMDEEPEGEQPQGNGTEG